MEHVGLLVLAGGMLAASGLLATAIRVSKPAKFDLAKTLNVTRGVYQNKLTSSMLQVLSVHGNYVYVVDATGGWTIDVRIIDSDYVKVGEL